ncbi:AAA-like domain-containing protein [Oscillatoriales cyanobacterium LEGE 11467]|uniref:AAA-like domain-containing protein n=1 Tax=Zarconia navalis LEGE 11467 TaxID=1828826 RepID=A0A928Z5L2_9CYAN|nr:AAA-like domain-containing protein [Zarconia navalis]MBE9039427.1 AAA-like domain-containing protein [Zarconia navalis LEGE 11467]
MDRQVALEFIDRLTFEKTGKHLSDLERKVFLGSWEGKTYEKIYPINPQYVEKDVGYKLWKKLSKVLGEKVKKKTIKGAIERARNYDELRITASSIDREKKSVSRTQTLFISHQKEEPDLSVAIELGRAVLQAGYQTNLGRDELTQIDEQLQQCDYFILFLSPQSAGSEMAIEQLRRIKELRDSRGTSKPMAIAIRIDCPRHFPLNHDLREYLHSSYQYEWHSNADTPELLRSVLTLLVQNEIAPPPVTLASPLDLTNQGRESLTMFDSRPLPVAEPELPSGQVRLASAFYIERSPNEKLCYKEIATPGALIRIKAPRQMGKTSLMARILYDARERGYRTAPLSFQHADTAVFTNLNQLLQWFCAKISRKLRLPYQVDDRWSSYFGSKDNCTAYFEDCLLCDTEAPLVLGLDEVDRVFQHPKIADDFFGLLRAWYEEAGYGDGNSKLWQQLRLVVVHSTEVYVPLNVNQSPFNVGLPIELPEFNLGQVRDLTQRHGLQWSRTQVERLMGWVGGHPYLVRLALYHISQGQLTLDELLQTAATEAGLYGDHLRRHLWSLQKHPELASAFGRAIASSTAVELESAIAFKLHSMGLVHLQGNYVTPRFELYRQYFVDRLGERNSEFGVRSSERGEFGEMGKS